MAVTGEGIRGAVRGLLGAIGSTEQARADQLSVSRNMATAPLTLAVNTGGTLPVHPSLDRGIRVNSFWLVPSATQASGATGLSVTLQYDNGAGGSATTIGTISSLAAGWTANYSYGGALAAPVTIPAGSRLFMVAAVQGAASVATTLQGSFTYDET